MSNQDLRGILIDLGDLAKNRLIPLILIVAVFVVVAWLWRGRSGTPR